MGLASYTDRRTTTNKEINNMDNNNAPSFEYDGAELMKIVEEQRNSALTQAAQLNAVCSRLSEDNRKLQAEVDRLRKQVGNEDEKKEDSND